MKNKFSLIVAISIALMIRNTEADVTALQYSTPTVGSAYLQNFYSFNGNANDSVGGNNFNLNSSVSLDNGSLNITTSIPEWPNNGYVSSENDLGITGDQSRTISFWFQAPLSSSAYTGSSGSNPAVCVGFGVNDGTQSGLFEANLYDQSMMFHGYGNDFNLTIPTAQVDWNMFTLTYDAGNMSVYLNGDFVGSQSVSSLDTGSGPLYIAGISGVLINDLGVWDTALSSGQVSTLYNASAVPEPATLSLVGLGIVSLIVARRRR